MEFRPPRRRSVPFVMAAERLKSPRARFFVGLDLPEPVLDGLVAWQREIVQAEPALRPAAPPMHVTLAFLGWQRERDAEAIAAAALSTESAAPRLALAPDPVAVPRNRQPRLYAVEFAAGDCADLQAVVSERLEQTGFYKPEKRPFWPHVTVARVRSERGARNRPRPVQTPPTRLPEALLEPFGAVRVTLYRSDLRPQGAEYTRMAGIELPLAAADS